MSTPFDLAGKTAAVTGGGRGLGLGISTALLEAGADVIVFGRSGVPVELTARAASLGRQVHFVALDLGAWARKDNQTEGLSRCSLVRIVIVKGRRR